MLSTRHFIAVLFAEQRHRARFDRVFRAHQAGGDDFVGADLGVHFGLDRGDVLGGKRGRVREVEAQAIRRDERALLRDVRTEAVAQRRVKQVRCRVVGADRIAARDIDVEPDHVADLDRAALHLCVVRVESRPSGLAVSLTARTSPSPPVIVPASPVLAAGLAVERGLVDDDGNIIARHRAVGLPCRP